MMMVWAVYVWQKKFAHQIIHDKFIVWDFLYGFEGDFID
jgi:hypothetical protein